MDINIQEPYFSFLKDGQKSVEGRLGKEKWLQLKKDEILIINKSLKLKIVKITKYKSFEEMLIFEGIKNVIPDKENLKDAVNVYREFFSIEDEKKYGVVAIKVKNYKIKGVKERF